MLKTFVKVDPSWPWASKCVVLFSVTRYTVPLVPVPLTPCALNSSDSWIPPWASVVKVPTSYTLPVTVTVSPWQVNICDPVIGDVILNLTTVAGPCVGAAVGVGVLVGGGGRGPNVSTRLLFSSAT